MTSRETLAKTQAQKLRSMSPAERMADALKPRKLTGFDVCLQATASKLHAAKGWVRTI